MNINNVSKDEVLFLKYIMNNEHFEKIRFEEHKNFGSYSLYFDENDIWNKRYKDHNIVPSELSNVILGYRWAKQYIFRK